MSSNDDVDAWIAQLMQCKPLSEAEVKKLCDKVSFTFSMVSESKESRHEDDALHGKSVACSRNRGALISGIEGGISRGEGGIDISTCRIGWRVTHHR